MPANETREAQTQHICDPGPTMDDDRGAHVLRGVWPGERRVDTGDPLCVGEPQGGGGGGRGWILCQPRAQEKGEQA